MFAPGRLSRRLRGVTLIELMITVAIIAILATLAAPSFRDMIVRNQLSALSNELMVALQYARSEAINRRGTVTLCRSANGIGCATAGGWEQGWIVFHDLDGDGTVDGPVVGPPAQPADAVLRVWPAASPGYTVRTDAGIGARLRYDPRGQARETGFFILCHARQADPLINSRALVVTTMRPRLATDRNGDRIPETDANANYSTCTP